MKVHDKWSMTELMVSWCSARGSLSGSQAFSQRLRGCTFARTDADEDDVSDLSAGHLSRTSLQGSDQGPQRTKGSLIPKNVQPAASTAKPPDQPQDASQQSVTGRLSISHASTDAQCQALAGMMASARRVKNCQTQRPPQSSKRAKARAKAESSDHSNRGGVRKFWSDVHKNAAKGQLEALRRLFMNKRREQSDNQGSTAEATSTFGKNVIGHLDVQGISQAIWSGTM